MSQTFSRVRCAPRGAARTARRDTDLREISAQSIGSTSLDLAHPTICGHYPEVRALLAKASSVVGKMASEDRPMPPADSFRRHLQPTPPEDSLGIHENTSQLVPESPPGLLRRETARPVEARALVVLITRISGFVHPPRCQAMRTLREHSAGGSMHSSSQVSTQPVRQPEPVKSIETLGRRI